VGVSAVYSDRRMMETTVERIGLAEFKRKYSGSVFAILFKIRSEY
jgi:hypothetical protein